ncbi:probable protein phosphatase 2C T23F11.1 [Anopheles ziemanni]|uniref:probable protein phosphatase 2C T23F11.1 n=1 Tax=Anopheles coustani TaxID=139045 RepID=UPI00265A0536|nr:probable protein phosphatase 2C T23F11.1 [Anopheles coustani]XP_058119077.1 probable protein phosphatase 2C T23F11.1 [Anopheles coustani]XP_058175167.1 probable protein phosphatase 2C T23F11.1 [Anopheles ziemanni]XP_058175168.1 probable protein phosphatase 2C T23F11.1 [Anopheles ziemanni]
MGQSLSEPETSKATEFCQNDYYKVGSSCMQGWRMHMEDSHTHILSLPDDPGTAFFAVYDGHGGAKVAEYAGKHLHKYITRRPEYGEDLKQALQRGFLDLDEAMLNNEALKEQMSGSTAVAVVIKDNRLYCANAGDSRAIACVNGRLDVLSFDHKPTNVSEMKRIHNAGGYVEYNRVNGYLALSRALGDFGLKRNQEKKPEEQMVTAYPDVEEREVDERWDFLVIACDGIWDVLSSQSVLEFVQDKLAQGMYPQQICENLMERCLAPDCQMGGIGGDNMTVIIVCFLHGQPFEQLIGRCKEAVAKREAKLLKRFQAKHSNGEQTTVTTTAASPLTVTTGSDGSEKTGANNEDDDDDDDDDGDKNRYARNGRSEDESSGSDNELLEGARTPSLQTHDVAEKDASQSTPKTSVLPAQEDSSPSAQDKSVKKSPDKKKSALVESEDDTSEEGVDLK